MDRLSRRTLCQIVESVTQINKYKICTMDQELADAAAYVLGQTLRVHSPDRSTFLHEMTPDLPTFVPIRFETMEP